MEFLFLRTLRHFLLVNPKISDLERGIPNYNSGEKFDSLYAHTAFYPLLKMSIVSTPMSDSTSNF